MTFKFITLRHCILLIIALLFIGLLIFAYEFRLYERTIFNFREWRHADSWRYKSLWLPDYQVTIEAKPIIGIKKNLSGLTWNQDTKTLFAIVNNPTQVIELTPTGERLRTINLTDVGDPEAIEYIGNNHFIIAEERYQKLIQIMIDKDTQQIDARKLEQITLGLGKTDNKGIEGLAWDSNNKRIYAAKERNPIHIYEVTGFPLSPNTTLDIVIENNAKRDNQLFIRDISGLDFNNHYGHLLVLSDESKLILEVDKKGRPISSLSLLMGAGLSRPIPQAEGIAMDDKNNLYLVSEPNLFYVFKKKSSP